MVKTTKSRIRSQMIICAATMGLVLGTAAHGKAASYTYTKLVDTSGTFLRFGSASINDAGRVAFSAALDTDGDSIADANGIFTSDGTTTTTIADSSNGFSLFGAPSIADGGTVAFSASLAGVNGIFTGSGGPTATIVDSSGMFNSFNSVSLGNGGTVAFGALLDTAESGIITSDGINSTIIASSSGPFSLLNLPAMNNTGIVVFAGSLDTGTRGVFSGNGGPTTTVVDSSGPFDAFSFPSSNDVGTVVFWARLDAGGFSIFKSDGTTVANSSGPFSNFGTPAINDAGTVAFQGFLPGSTGIFTGPDPLGDKVIGLGDLLDGVQVTGLGFAREGLNDAGQVAFVASLADGTQAIYRANPEGAGDPIPPPPDPAPLPNPVPPSDPPSQIDVLIDIKPGNKQNTINPGSKGVVVVAILGSAEFDALTVNPESLELSGAYVKEKGKGTLMARYKDANGDGYVDLVVHVETQSLSLAESTTITSTTDSSMKALLTGETWGGKPITGSDTVNVVP